MKRKALGIFIMAVGCVMLAASVTLCVGAAESGTTGIVDNSIPPEKEISIEGSYALSDGSEEILITKDGFLSVNGAESVKCELKIWKDIPKTDEATGKITLTDYYYIEAGGVRYDFNPLDKTLTLGNRVYK